MAVNSPSKPNIDGIYQLNKEELTKELQNRGLPVVGNITAKRNRLIKNWSVSRVIDPVLEVIDNLIPNTNDEDPIPNPNINNDNISKAVHVISPENQDKNSIAAYNNKSPVSSNEFATIDDIMSNHVSLINLNSNDNPNPIRQTPNFVNPFPSPRQNYNNDPQFNLGYNLDIKRSSRNPMSQEILVNHEISETVSRNGEVTRQNDLYNQDYAKNPYRISRFSDLPTQLQNSDPFHRNPFREINPINFGNHSNFYRQAENRFELPSLNSQYGNNDPMVSRNPNFSENHFSNNQDPGNRGFRPHVSFDAQNGYQRNDQCGFVNSNTRSNFPPNSASAFDVMRKWN